ncbi:MAG: ABC transporter ATP-binding protein [Balneolaceae bacterium]
MNKTNKNGAVDSVLIRRLYQFLRPYRWYVLLAILLTLAASFLAAIGPKLTQIAIDDYIEVEDFQGLAWIVLLLIAVLIGEFILLVANTYLTRWFGQGTLFSLRNAVFKKIQSLHVQFFDRNPIGRLITRTTSDIEALSELLSDGVVNMAGDLFRIIFILAFMIAMSWELTLVTILVLPILFYATFWFKSRVRISFLDVRDQIARLNSFVQEHINGLSIVQLFNREKKESEKFLTINSDHRRAHIDTIFYFSIFWPLVEVLASLAMALVVWYGGARVLTEELTLGVLVAFIQYARQFFNPIRGLSEKYNTLQSALASSERIFNVLDTENRITDPDNPLQLDKMEGRIEFRNVWFRYLKSDENYIIRDISFTVEPGESIAVVGATGAGKTTLINLLLRFYDIEKGEIFIDGTEIRKLALKDLRSRFALVLQDNALFAGTILDNITLGNSEIGRDKVERAAREVGAHRFISRLPGGYDFPLRERGSSLSMGQRQLICFVRAMVYDPEILILDEATSNIDTRTEELVARASKKMMKHRTSVVIAHRLSTIRDADRILVMHKGELRESGSHSELLAREDGIYRRLHELQYREQDWAVGSAHTGLIKSGKTKTKTKKEDHE